MLVYTKISQNKAASNPTHFLLSKQPQFCVLTKYFIISQLIDMKLGTLVYITVMQRQKNNRCVYSKILAADQKLLTLGVRVYSSRKR